MPDTMQCPAEVAEERTALWRANKALCDKLKEARATLEAAHAALSTGSIEDAVPAKLLIEYTMINTVLDTAEPGVRIFWD